MSTKFTHRLLVISLVTLGFHWNSFGQNDSIVVGDVIGRVINEETQEIIHGASIYWQNEKRRSVTTNEEGIFRIRKNSENEILVISNPGKRDQLIPYDKIVSNFWEINVSLVDLGVTSVTASRWEQEVNETPSSIVVVTREEIEANGYISLQEILENVPGLFTIDHRSETGVTIGIRGFWADFNKSVMIQINGVNMLSERRNDFPFFKINIGVESIDKIEIVRGPMSVIYGAGAFFGVINIITNDGQTPERNILSSGVGLPLTQRNFFRYSTNVNGLQLSFNATTFYRQGFKENWEDFVDTSNYNSGSNVPGYPNAQTIHDYSGAINTDRYSTKNQSLNVSMVYKNFFSNIHFTNSNFGISYLHPGPNDRNTYTSFAGNFQAGYKGSLFKDQFDYQLKSTYMRGSDEIEYDYFQPNDSLFNVGQNHVASLRNELNTRWMVMNSSKGNKVQLDLISGLYFNRNFENHSLYNAPEFAIRNWYVGLDPDSHVDTYAGYAQANLLIRKLQFVAGIRLEEEGGYQMLNIRNGGFYDPITGVDLGGDPGDTTAFEQVYLEGYKEKGKLKMIPRIAAIYSIADTTETRTIKNIFKLMYGTAATEPTVAQNAQDIMFNNYANKLNDSTYVARPFLTTEKIRTAEIGHTFSAVFKTQEFEASTNIFYNHLVGLITRETTTAGTFVGISSNSDSIRTIGIETLFRYTKKWNSSTKTRSSSNAYVDRSRIPSTIKLTGTASFTYQNTRYLSTNQTGDTVSFSPPVLATFQIRLLRKMWSFSFISNYVGRMHSYYSYKKSAYSGQFEEDYIRLSANIRYQVPMKNKNLRWSFYVNLKMDNILNTNYQYPTYSVNPWANKGIVGRGRVTMLSLGYLF